MVDGILKQAKKGAAVAAFAQSGSSSFGEPLLRSVATSFTSGSSGGGRNSNSMRRSASSHNFTAGAGSPRTSTEGAPRRSRRASMAGPPPTDASKLSRRASFEDLSFSRNSVRRSRASNLLCSKRHRPSPRPASYDHGVPPRLWLTGVGCRRAHPLQ